MICHCPKCGRAHESFNFGLPPESISGEYMSLRSALERARTVFENMALENTGYLSFIRRWPISHEPLRVDARNLLPVIDAALSSAQGGDKK